MPRIRYKLIGLLAVVLIAMPLLAQAAAGEDFSKAVQGVFDFFVLILNGLQAALWPVLLLTGGLLNNDLLFSGGMQTMLLNIWTAIRDFVNIIFVLGLLFVAIYNIIGLAPDDYSIPKVLPKIAIGLIAVNFSFLMCKVVLDVVNVTTTAIFSVPLASSALAKYQDPLQQDELSKKVCENIMNMEGMDEETMKKNPYCEKDPSAGAGAGSGQTTSTAQKAKYVLNNAGKAFFSTFNSRNAAMVMAIELMEITTVQEVPKNVDGLKKLAINAIFSLIFMVIYASAFVALFVTMLVRVIVLWITIALMPLSFLKISFGQKVEKMMGENDPMTLFFGHALVPIKVAVVLTIGMIMITQLKQMVPGITYSTDPKMLGAITSNMSSLQSIMASLATAAFIWIAAFEAMKGTKASTFVDTYIKKPVQDFGMNVAKLPLYAPILPTGKGKDKVGLAFLTAGIAGGGGLGEMLRKKDQEYLAMSGNKEGAAAKALEGANSAKDAEKKIATLIVEANHSVLPENQKLMYAQFDKWKELKTMRPPGTPGMETMDKFLAALKEGKVTKEQMEAFYKANPTRLQPTDMARESAVAAADKAISAAGPAVGGTPVEKLGEAAKLLKTKKEALAKADTPEKAASLRAEVEKLTQQVTALTALFNDRATKDNIKESRVGEGAATTINPTQAGYIKEAYDKATQGMEQKDKDQVTESLIRRVQSSLEVPTEQAKNIVNNIINPSANPAPDTTAAASTAANSAPAGTNTPPPGAPPGPVPPAGTP